MKALTYGGPGVVRYEDAPEPALLEPTDAIVEVEAAAICGSDLHVYQGRERGLDFGTVLGHEFVGRVLSAGAAVTGVAPGDRVVSPFTTSCGNCFYCARGLTARCASGQFFGQVENGAGLHGGQAERVRVPLASTTLVLVPEDLELEIALLLGDVLATGHDGAVSASAAPGAACAVVGCGPIGLAAVLAARALGADPVLAVDVVRERLALAVRFGAAAVDASAVDPVAAVRAATDGRGADGVVEAVGSPEAGRLAFELVRPGGTIAAVGVHHEASFPFSPGQAYAKNLTYRSGRCPVRGLIGAVLPLARNRRAELAALFTHRLPLSAGSEAYETFAARRDGCVKVLLTPRAL